MRLIDADKLNEEIKNKFGYFSATAFVRNIQNLSQVEVFKHIMRLIEKAPTIENRQPGEWLEDSGVIACSHCHIIWLYRRTNYCPNCGAKMEGEDET